GHFLVAGNLKGERGIDATASDPDKPEAAERRHLLLAEDNMGNQREAMGLLEKRGHRVAVASNGNQALEWLERERFDVIVMDVQMPGLDGIETTAIIREQERKTGCYTPIIALTARTMAGDREQCMEAGMDNYINKPIDAVQ